MPSRPIKKDEIEKEIKAYLKIKKNSEAKLQELPYGDGKYYLSPEISFLFELEDILSLLAKYTGRGCNAIKAYYGVNGNKNATVMLVPFKVTYYEDDEKQPKTQGTTLTKTIKTLESLVTAEDDEGVEWPDGFPPCPGADENNFDIGNDNCL